MKRRIRRIKDHLYPMFIYEARRRRMWALVQAAQVRFSKAIREAYARSRNELPPQ
jgi:hypothetical protein